MDLSPRSWDRRCRSELSHTLSMSVPFPSIMPTIQIILEKDSTTPSRPETVTALQRLLFKMYRVLAAIQTPSARGCNCVPGTHRHDGFLFFPFFFAFFCCRLGQFDVLNVREYNTAQTQGQMKFSSVALEVESPLNSYIRKAVLSQQTYAEQEACDTS